MTDKINGLEAIAKVAHSFTNTPTSNQKITGK